MKRDITNINSKGQHQGYQESGWGGKLWYRYNSKNGKEDGYEEYYGLGRIGGKIYSLKFYIL